MYRLARPAPGMHHPGSDPADDPDDIATRLDELDGFLEEVRGGDEDEADGGASDTGPDRDHTTDDPDAAPADAPPDELSVDVGRTRLPGDGDRDGPEAGAAPGVGGFWGPGFEPAAGEVAWAEPPAPSGESGADGADAAGARESRSGPGAGSGSSSGEDEGGEDGDLGEMLEGLEPVDLTKA